MPANLTLVNGKAQMAYNQQNGHPWHRLGEAMPANMYPDEALRISGSDDTVVPVTLYARLPDGTEVESPDSLGVWSDKYGLITGKAGLDYTVTQRREIVDLALQIVGLSGGDAVIDTMLNIGEKARVFATYIKVPELVIDPDGIADTLERGLAAGTSFDTSLPNFIHYTEIRTVCENTLMWGFHSGKQTIRVKHTKNSESRIIEAARALEYIGVREKEIVKKAEKMLSIPQGGKVLQGVMDHFWPITEDLSSAAKTRREGIRGSVQQLYSGMGNKNLAVVGDNGYAAFNTMVEYLDHFRGVNGKQKEIVRAEAAVLPGEILKQKDKVAQLVLAAA